MPASLQQKLQLKTGQEVVVLNPPQGYLESLRAELKENTISTKAGIYAQAIILFVNSLGASN